MVHPFSQEYRRSNRGRSLSSIGSSILQLKLLHQATGPISIAAYMRQCLTSANGGYYTSVSAEKDPFGPKGDFITSPEISQVFGELLGIWLVAEWMAQGRINQGVEIIEVGPGRGTLMDDLLRVCYKGQFFTKIPLTEFSPTQRRQSANSSPLCQALNRSSSSKPAPRSVQSKRIAFVEKLRCTKLK